MPCLQWRYLSDALISGISVCWKENEYETAKKDFCIHRIVYTDGYILIVCKEEVGSAFEGKCLLLVLKYRVTYLSPKRILFFPESVGGLPPTKSVLTDMTDSILKIQ